MRESCTFLLTITRLCRILGVLRGVLRSFPADMLTTGTKTVRGVPLSALSTGRIGLAMLRQIKQTVEAVTLVIARVLYKPQRTRDADRSQADVN